MSGGGTGRGCVRGITIKTITNPDDLRAELYQALVRPDRGAAKADSIDTVGELIAALAYYDPDTPIRLATQPHWPFEYTLGGVARTLDDADSTGTDPAGEPVVWIAMGRQVDYLPAIARDALGWSQ